MCLCGDGANANAKRKRTDSTVQSSRVTGINGDLERDESERIVEKKNDRSPIGLRSLDMKMIYTYCKCGRYCALPHSLCIGTVQAVQVTLRISLFKAASQRGQTQLVLHSSTFMHKLLSAFRNERGERKEMCVSLITES